MQAHIITIGDEILIGQVVDTNSAWIARELNLIGIPVHQIVSIADSREAILSAINQSIKNVRLVVVTGGLGPTSDDITKQTLREYFGGDMVLHHPTLNHIERLFAIRGLSVTETNRKQALVPSTCVVLHNNEGTAPGMWFERQGSIVVSLPGVPFEMESIMRHEVLPRLKALNSDSIVVHRTIQTFGLPESFLADKLSAWEAELPGNVKLAYLPSPTAIRLRLSAWGSAHENLLDVVDAEIGKLIQIIPEYIFGMGEVSLQRVVGEMLHALGCTLSTAESCTGGTIAHLITQVPGSSHYFKGSIVAYSNGIKERLLGVPPALICKNGAVSREVVEAMAAGVKRALGTSHAIAVSGIAGPEGGTDTKPVGLVWIAVASDHKVVSNHFRFGNSRERNIIRSSAAALNMLRLLLVEENPTLQEKFFRKIFE